MIMEYISLRDAINLWAKTLNDTPSDHVGGETTISVVCNDERVVTLNVTDMTAVPNDSEVKS